MIEPLLSVVGLTKTYHRHGKPLVGVKNCSFSMIAGETVALVGPSGSGKSTLARLLLRLITHDSGTIRFQGEDWLGLKGAALRKQRAAMQMVFQDPLAAFNPRQTVEDALVDPLRVHGLVHKEHRSRTIAAMLDQVGLPSTLLKRGFTEISGGQRQRVAIARALILQPELLVLDEAVSALDVTVREQVLSLLSELQRQIGCAYLFITHDLAVAQAIAQRIIVMDKGQIVEDGITNQVINAPQAAITKALIAASPRRIV